MEHGYALAGSSVRSSGWFIEDALTDDLALLGEFRRMVGRPTQTIAWGVSTGRARTALVAALREIPVSGLLGTGGLGPGSLPSGQSLEDLRAAQLADLVSAALRDYFLNHPALERRAGGNPSSNQGIDYGHLLAASPDFAELKSLYQAAGLSLDNDVARLNRAPRVSSDPAAVAYVSRFLTFTGGLRVPVVTLHTLADESTAVQLEDAYLSKVRRAGRSAWLRQLFVDRGVHCSFTTAEIPVALDALRSRIATGKWGRADDLATLNSETAAFGAQYQAPIGVKVVGIPATQSSPSFVAFESIGLLRDAAGEP